MKGGLTMSGSERNVLWLAVLAGVVGVAGSSSCRATVAGDPDRPIKIEAHITLDVRQVKEAATSIEDMVSGQAPVPAKGPSSRFWDGAAAKAWAAPPELKVITPEVQAVVDSRKGRFSRLKELKAQGLVGEDNQGRVAALGGGADVQQLVEEENRDREVIYRAIVEQNSLGAEALPTVRATFAEVQREKADPGEKIQTPSGDWTTK